MRRDILHRRGNAIGSILPPQAEIIPNLVTAHYLSKLFRRSMMQIYQWRNRKGLPYVIVTGGKIPMQRFNIHKVLAWAKHVKARMFLVDDKDL